MSMLRSLWVMGWMWNVRFKTLIQSPSWLFVRDFPVVYKSCVPAVSMLWMRFLPRCMVLGVKTKTFVCVFRYSQRHTLYTQSRHSQIPQGWQIHTKRPQQMESGNRRIRMLDFKRDSDLDIMWLQLSWEPFQHHFFFFLHLVIFPHSPHLHNVYQEESQQASSDQWEHLDHILLMEHSVKNGGWKWHTYQSDGVIWKRFTLLNNAGLSPIGPISHGWFDC